MATTVPGTSPGAACQHRLGIQMSGWPSSSGRSGRVQQLRDRRARTGQDADSASGGGTAARPWSARACRGPMPRDGQAAPAACPAPEQGVREVVGPSAQATRCKLQQCPGPATLSPTLPSTVLLVEPGPGRAPTESRHGAAPPLDGCSVPAIRAASTCGAAGPDDADFRTGKRQGDVVEDDLACVCTAHPIDEPGSRRQSRRFLHPAGIARQRPEAQGPPDDVAPLGQGCTRPVGDGGGQKASIQAPVPGDDAGAEQLLAKAAFGGARRGTPRSAGRQRTAARG
jgi:hypothetical protein